MKRRTFLQAASAAVATPALPIAANAAPVVAAAPAAAAQPYIWAEFVARVHNSASPAMFQRLLKLDEATANGVYRELLRDKVITAPDAFGISKAARPYPHPPLKAGGAKPGKISRAKPKVEKAFAKDPSRAEKGQEAEVVEQENEATGEIPT
ncbi:MAG: hypothetical protein AAF393_07150 [Pseudomonadota bacterium]